MILVMTPRGAEPRFRSPTCRDATVTVTGGAVAREVLLAEAASPPLNTTALTETKETA